jgi:Lon protease-like protein
VLPTVLFPDARMPLHVFEPRYRQMAARCLENDRRFGLLYHDAKASGVYALADGGIGCLAEIEQFQPLPDGRSLLVARGVERFRIADGIESGEKYHEALVEEYGDSDSRLHDMAVRREASIDLFGQALARASGASGAPPFDTAHDVSFQLAASMEISTPWQQMLLEMQSETARLDEIDKILRAMLGAPRGQQAR